MAAKALMSSHSLSDSLSNEPPTRASFSRLLNGRMSARTCADVVLEHRACWSTTTPGTALRLQHACRS